MTADIELLPLPEPNGSYTNPYDGDDIENYARANVEHHTAAKDAEIEDLVKANEQVQKLALDTLTDRDELKAEIERLRVEVALLRVGAENERLHQRVLLVRERERAERLAEALRLIAAPPRPDGTWNRGREACRQIAEEALLDYGPEVFNG